MSTNKNTFSSVVTTRGDKDWRAVIARLFSKREPLAHSSFSEDDLKALRSSGEARLLLGRDDRGDVLFLPRRANAPTVIVGDQWADIEGVSTSLAMQRIAMGDGLVFIDFEGSSYVCDRLAETARICGRESDFYVLTPKEPERSHTYSPWTNGDADELAAKGLLSFPPNEENPAASSYEFQRAHYLLTVLSGALIDAKRTFTTSDLLMLIQSRSALEALLDMLPDVDSRMPVEVMLNEFRDSSGQLDMAKLEQFTAYFSERLSALDGEGPRRMDAENPEVDIAEIVRQGKCL